MNPLPLLYHPTQVVILDDEASFVEHLEVDLEDEAPNIKSFTDPQEALVFVQKNAMSGLTQEKWIRPGEDELEPEEYTLSIQIQNLRSKMQDQTLFNQTTRAVVDYQMTGMNGIEWCKQVTAPLVQKILLTGAADEKFGIEAMNRGWIDMYVRKQDPDMIEKLLAGLKRAQLKSFSKLTQGLHFAITQCSEDTALLDPAFTDFFLKYVETNQIVEYYLIEAMGSFLMVDANAQRHCLFVQTRAKVESNLQLVLHLVKDCETKNDLENVRKIICCPAPQNFVTSEGVNYKPYLFQANKFEGQQLYYWAITPDLFGNEND